MKQRLPSRVEVRDVAPVVVIAVLIVLGKQVQNVFSNISGGLGM
jgi:hypothetical protein